MKNLLLRISALLIVLCAIFAFNACDKEQEHVHSFGEWITVSEPTTEARGLRQRACSGCELVETEEIAALPKTFTVTIVDGESETKVSATEDGAYQLSPLPAKIGYTAIGYFDVNGNAFLESGIIASDVTVYARYEISPTTSFIELKERIEAGADILLAANITLTDTIYVKDELSINSSGAFTLTRAESFLGDLFIIGSDSLGNNPLLQNKKASLKIKPDEGKSISFDGNKNNVQGSVSGTAFIVKNSSTLEIFDGVEIINCKKTSNDYFLKDGHNMSDPELIGGSAVIIASGIFNMYGGAIRNCEVTMADSAYTPKAEQTEGYNYSSRGGAVFNYGNFNMYGGTIENCQGGRGGAIYNYRVMYLVAGEVKNNYTLSYGGAVYNPNSQYIYAVIGSEGTDIKMHINNNSSAKTGGAIYVAHQSTVYVKGATEFKENKALSGNGGAFNAGGAVVIDYALFDGNTASSKGGAIYAYYNSPENSIRLIVINAASFINNSAPRGGAIGLNCGEDVSVGSIAEFGDVEFKNNKAPLATDGKYGYGAAIHIDQASKLTIYGSTSFTENVSEGNGGAVYITKASSFNITPVEGKTVTFKGNSSKTGNGGALYNSGSTVIATGEVIFTENESLEGNGGAIAVHSEGTVKLYGTSLTKNKATAGNGGALYVYGANAVIGDDGNTKTSVFTENSSEKGGALYVAATSKANTTLNAHTITASNNTASAGGGAIYLVATDSYSASFNAKSLILSGNEAGGNGGAMYIYTKASANIESVSAEGNKTASGKYGGFAYVSGGASVYFGNVSATNNSASSGGAIYLTTKATTLTIAGGDIRSNLADSLDLGNGIWVNSASSKLILKTSASDEILLVSAEGDVLGVEGFQLTTYKE